MIAGAGASKFLSVQAFRFVGETLRRLRKELGKTLEELGAEANLGRGQLSRIENARQEATLSTLAKILDSQGVSRGEFFRRYDLVEAEAVALGRSKPAASPAEAATGSPSVETPELQEVVGKIGRWFHNLTAGAPSVAKGMIELGGYVVTFQVIPKVEPVPDRRLPEEVSAGDRPDPRAGEPKGSRRKRAVR